MSPRIAVVLYGYNSYAGIIDQYQSIDVEWGWKGPRHFDLHGDITRWTKLVVLALHVNAQGKADYRTVATWYPAQNDNSILIAPASPPKTPAERGETFYTADVIAKQPDTEGHALLGLKKDGSGLVRVDDLLDIQVTHEDGTKRGYSYDFSDGCTHQPVHPAAIDLTDLLAPGTNRIHVALSDLCNTPDSNDDIYLVGNGQYSLTDSSATPERTYVVSPDLKVVRYIHSFRIDRCTKSMLESGALNRMTVGGVPASGSTLITAATALCTGVQLSHNPSPGTRVASTERQWLKFLDTKQYRGFVHLPPYRATCVDGKIIRTPEPMGTPSTSTGYTPPPLGNFFPGEHYADQDGDWDEPSPRVYIADDRKSAQITYKLAARLGTLENVGSGITLKRTAPFIWTKVTTTLACSGDVTAETIYSAMPATTVYQDGQRVVTQNQNNEFGPFQVEGGFHPVPGHGNLYSKCAGHRLLPAPERLRPDCKLQITQPMS